MNRRVLKGTLTDRINNPYLMFLLGFLAVLLILIIPIGLSFFITNIIFNQTNELNQACINIGYHHYESAPDQPYDYCIDSHGNYHYVKTKMISFRKYEAKEVSVGGVRIAP